MEKRIVDSVPIIQYLPDVFLEDLEGVSHEMSVEFQIDLVMGAALIGKALYHLSHPKMHEFSTQLQELLDKGFIMPSNLPWAALIFCKEEG